MLKNANTAAILDVTNLYWTEQSPLVGSAIIRAIKELSGVECTTKELRPIRTSKDGRANNVRILVQVPTGIDNAESFQFGSRVGLAMTNPRFEGRVNAILAQLSGHPSSILEIIVSLNEGVLRVAPGLVVDDPTPDTVLMRLDIYKGTQYYDVYEVKLGADLPTAGVATLNYHQTPLEAVDGAEELHSVTNQLYNETLGVPASLVGDWKFSGSDILTDLEATPTLTDFTYVLEGNDVDGPVSIRLTKDGVDVYYIPPGTMSKGALDIIRHDTQLKLGVRGDILNIIQMVFLKK